MLYVFFMLQRSFWEPFRFNFLILQCIRYESSCVIENGMTSSTKDLSEHRWLAPQISRSCIQVAFSLVFYSNLNKERKVDEPLFVPKQNSKEWQQQKQPVNHIDFQPTTAENCFRKMKEKKCNTQQICSRGWVSHSFSGKELTFPRLSFAHLCGSSSSGLEIEVGGLQCVSCSRSNGLFKQIAPILGIDS